MYILVNGNVVGFGIMVLVIVYCVKIGKLLSGRWLGNEAIGHSIL